MKLLLDTNILVAAVTHDTERSEDAIDATLVSFDSELVEYGAELPANVI